MVLKSAVAVSNDKGPKEKGPTVTKGFVNQMDAPLCSVCGHVTVRNGACYKCLNCGESLGCS